jgi:ABC-2 type transport system permease protein
MVMLNALFYLQWHSFRNRLTSRVRRLKQPKYLIGAVVGFAYFYFYFFRFLIFPSGWRAAGNLALSPEHRLVLESLGALALVVVVFVAWLIPHERAALTFTEAEVAFLFPAPISRRGLIHFKLVRSQLRILFTTLILLLLGSRGHSVWIRGIGWWLIFSTLHLHLLGSSFARTLLLDRGISNWRRRGLVLGLAFALAAGMLLWARGTLPGLEAADLSDPNALMDYARRLLMAGPLAYVLYPFRLLTRVLLAPDAAAFLRVIGPAILLLGLHYAWVVGSNTAFEEASVEASQKLAVRLAAVRAGKWHAAAPVVKGRRPLFRLGATGPPAIGLLWKNLISAGHAFTWRLWIILTVLAVCLYVALGNGVHRGQLLPGVAMAGGMLLAWSLLLGPQVARQDLRQDLPLLDMLKVYPLRGWQVVLGELLAPVVILTAAQWLVLVLATGLVLGAHGLSDGPLPPAIAVGAAMLLPVIDLLLLLIPNVAVLLFPSWIQTGRDAPRGVEATGQRLILFLGQFIVFLVAMSPATAVFLLVFFLVKLVLGPAAAVPLASLAAAAMLAAEGALGVWLAGRLFERLDVSAETIHFQ